MPFIFRDHADKILHVSHCSDDEWLAFRNGWRVHGLRMACCDAEAIPVDLPEYRTRFMRHHPGEECRSAGESIEHQAVKADAAVAAQAAGWTIQIEGGGTAPDGQMWRADVLCSRGAERVAIEIQMSRQSLAEYRRRQVIYAASGVKGVWFAGHKGFERQWSTSDLPIFPIHLKDLKADVEPARGRQFRLPVGQFVSEFLGGRWYCREPIVAPAVIIPELSVCLDCGREVLTGRTIAAYPGEADPVYPPGPIFGKLTDVLFDGGTLAQVAWDKHEIVAMTGNAPDCPYCSGRLRSHEKFTLETLCKARHGIKDRHGSILLAAGGWWRRGEPLVPRNWIRPSSPPTGSEIPVKAIIERQCRRLPDYFRAPLLQRARVLSAIRSSVDDLFDWKAMTEFCGEIYDREDGLWLADIVLQETEQSQGGRRIAFFLALEAGALEHCRKQAQRARKAGYEAIVLNPTSELQPFADRPVEVTFSCFDQPEVVIAKMPVPLAQFVADLVRGKWVQKSIVKVPYSLVPVPASCPSCGRTGSMEAFLALHFGEADTAFGDGIAIMPATTSWYSRGYASQSSRRSDGYTKTSTCLCGEKMVSSIAVETLLADCGDLQVRDGLWHCSVGPWVRRGSVPMLDEAVGLVAGHRTWTRESWLEHAERIAPPPDSEAVRQRRSLRDAIRSGVNATGWLVDESHADRGVVLVHGRGGARIAIAFLSTIPGPWAEQRQNAEVKAADTVLLEVQAEETFWLTMVPDPVLPRRYGRPAISIGWEAGAYALPAPNDPVPLDRFVTDLLEGGWEYVGREPLTLSLVPERVRCSCGEVSYIAPWCAAKAADRPAPSFARIVGKPDSKARLLPLDTAKSLRQSAERQLRMPPFENRDGGVEQSCGRCGRVLTSSLTTETLRQRWSGPGVGYVETSIDLYCWYRLAEPILAGSLTVPGRLDAPRLTIGEWLSDTSPQQSLF